MQTNTEFYFISYRNVEPLYYTPETNMILTANCNWKQNWIPINDTYARNLGATDVYNLLCNTFKNTSEWMIDE